MMNSFIGANIYALPQYRVRGDGFDQMLVANPVAYLNVVDIIR